MSGNTEQLKRKGGGAARSAATDCYKTEAGMATFTESDTIETLSSEQLEMMSKTDHSWLIDYIASATRFDAHRIRLMLEFGQDAVKRKMEGL